MFRTRRALPWAAALILLLQVTIGSVSLSALAPMGDGSADVACTCFHGADGHAMCPMHHTKSGEARCRVRGMDDQSALALATLLAPTAAPALAPAALAPPPVAVRTQATPTLPTGRALSPDLPPPRS